MKKWFKYIFITTILMIIGYSGVEAKVVNTCEYKSDDWTIKLQTDDVGAAGAQIFGGIRDITGIGDIETPYTVYGNKWKSTECPKYALYEVAGSNELYVSDSKKNINKKIEDRKFKSGKYYVIKLSSKNGVGVEILDDEETLKCVSKDGAYTFYVNHNTQTVQLEAGLCDVVSGYDYSMFEKGCPNIYGSKNGMPNGQMACTFSLDKTIGSDVTAWNDDESTNNTDNPNAYKDVAYGTFSCDNSSETIKLLRQVYKLLRYLVPVLIIGLSIVDFVKVVANGEDKVFKEAWSKFVKRLIIGVIILILPALLAFIIKLSGVVNMYGIDENNIFCIFD